MKKHISLIGAAALAVLIAVPALAQNTEPFAESVTDGLVISRFDDLTRVGEARFESVLEALDAAEQPYVLVDQDLRTRDDAAQLADDTNALATLDGYEASDGSLKMRLTWGTRAAQVLLFDDNAVAEDIEEEPLTLTPDMEPAFVADYVRGNFLYAYAEDEEAMRFLEDAFSGLPAGQEVESEAIQLFVTYGLLLNRYAEYEKALDVIQYAIEIDRDFSYSYFIQARALRYLERLDDAVDAINLAIANGNRDVYFSELGRIYILQEEYDQATEAYNAALEIDAASSLALVGLGDVAFFQGDIEGSVPLFEQAIEADPAYSYAYYSLAYSLNELNRPEEALEAINQAVETDPAYVDAIVLLGDIQYVLGDKEAAAEAYQRYLDLGGQIYDYIEERLAEVN